MLPILFVPQMLFAGFFVAPELIPVWLRWARYLCSLTYAVRIALVAEFGDGCPEMYPNGTVVEDGEGQAVDPCYNLLDSVDANSDETWW
jgi:hypothetical protein